MCPKIRIDNLSSNYVDIAMQHYYDAKIMGNHMIYDCDAVEAFQLQSDFYKHSIISIVFSHMAIEAFLNDYAATYLGDNTFYGNYDNLNTLSKFHFIATFVLQAEFDKSKSYYGLLKDLTKRRNAFVHNKSQEIDLPDSDKDIPNGVEFEYPARRDTEYKQQLRETFNALKAIRELAIYFDKNDKGFNAIGRLFWPTIVEESIEYKKSIEYKVESLSDLGIKFRIF